MNLEQFKKILSTATNVNFKLHSGEYVPEHFHVTEVGVIHKHFIDCGGTIRQEKVANFQLWNANDTDHRLKPQKLLNIIQLSEQKLGLENFEIEVEYQTNTIGKYELEFDGNDFILLPKNTACLANETCGTQNNLITKNYVVKEDACCSPGGGCC